MNSLRRHGILYTHTARLQGKTLGPLSNANRIRVTLTSFLAYFIMSSVITPLGIVTQPMSDYFGVEVTSATAMFSYLTTGILLGTFLSMFIYSVLSVRTVHVSASVVLMACLGGVWLIDSLSGLSVLFVFIGTGCGLLLSAALIVLAQSYSERRRAPVMLVTDLFYSGAGVISGVVSGTLIERGFYWGSVYALAIVAAGLLIVIAAVSRYPSGGSQDVGVSDATGSARWPAGVYVIAIALLIYIMSFVFIYSWIPNYAAEAMRSSAEQGGALVSRFFLGLFVGQLAMFALVFKLNLRFLIGATASLAVVASCGLWYASSYDALMGWMFALGLLSGGLLKTLMSYTTALVSRPSARLVSFVVFSTAAGTSLAPAVSALIVDEWGIRAVLIAVSLGYATMASLVLSTFAMTGRPAGSQ